MKKIIFVINTIPDKTNSAAYQRACILGNNYDCILLTRHAPPNELKELFSKVYNYNFSIISYLFFLHKIYILKKNCGYQVVYTQHNIYTLSVGFFSKILFKCKWVYDLWDHPSLGYQMSTSYFRVLKSLYWTSIGYLMLKKADLWIVAMSKGIYKYLPNYSGKIIEVSRGYSLKDNTHNKNKFITLTSPLILVSIGWLSKNRGTNTLINILKELSSRNISATVRAAGPIDAYSRKAIENHNKTSSNKIEYLGYLSQIELIEVYKTSHIGFCFLDKSIINYNYAYPIKVIEYMLNKTLVIGTNTEGILSIVEHGKSGYTVSNEVSETASIIEELQSKPQLYNEIINNAFEKSILSYDINKIEYEIKNAIKSI